MRQFGESAAAMSSHLELISITLTVGSENASEEASIGTSGPRILICWQNILMAYFCLLLLFQFTVVVFLYVVSFWT